MTRLISSTCVISRVISPVLRMLRVYSLILRVVKAKLLVSGTIKNESMQYKGIMVRLKSPVSRMLRMNLSHYISFHP